MASIAMWASSRAVWALTGNFGRSALAATGDQAPSRGHGSPRQPRRQGAPCAVCFHSGSTLQQQPQAKPRQPAPKQAHQRGPFALYQAGLDERRYRHDVRQEVAMELLQSLFLKLEALYPRTSKPRNLTLVDNVSTKQKKASWWQAITAATDPHLGDIQPDNANRPRGLYMWGGVGVGKTMLMDLFVAAAPREFHLRRTHFHDFMLDVHTRLRKHRGDQDPLRKVADSVASETRVLCLDELFVTDVADAMILERLFGRLWDRGMTVVATSNRRPNTLYEGGLQRALFLPFIRRLERETTVHDMDSPTDYRQLATKTVGVYFVRLVEGRSNDARLATQFAKVTEGAAPEAVTVDVAMGRHLAVPCAVGRMCMFSFDELCGAAVGASDYIALVSAFHTLALRRVPVFTAATRAQAYRFVTLVDIMYEHRIKLLMSAEDYAGGLFRNIRTQEEARAAGPLGADVVVDDNLGFAKGRTVSRLTEMQTMEYAIAHAERNAPELLLALLEAQSAARKA